MMTRNQRPTIHRFSIGGLLGAIGLLLVVYFTVVNIAEANRALAASKDSLAKISGPSIHRLDRADPDDPYATRPNRHAASRRLAHSSARLRTSAAPLRPVDR